ncbi:MAG: tRNA pseudouridine(38-40) synthase TruA [Marinobacter sp.]|nr:tRNA pseudouridine(38-40) synthase TruA [Marinobacter sp.]
MFRSPQLISNEVPAGPGRVALVFEYDGAAFHGWQQQKSGVPSVEAVLTKAIGKVAAHPVELVCAGRTDAGVHAAYQVVHFDTQVARSQRSWVMGINTHLPPSVTVHWAGAVAEDFHARFSAFYRRYRYVIFNSDVRPALFRGQLSWTYQVLDTELMHQEAQVLAGEHDFSAFRAAECQSKSAKRNVTAISVQRKGRFVILDVQANAFLHHMVRNFAGSLMAVGCGKQAPGWLASVLASGDRRQAGITAQPNGLYLVDVGYPEHFGIPVADPGPSIVRDLMIGEA